MLTWPKPFPKPGRRRDDEPFWDSIARRRLELQRCGACGRFRYPAAPVCPECLLEAVEWVPANGNGEVLSWCVFHRQYLEAFPPPHVVVAVRLAEGLIMCGFFQGEVPTDARSEEHTSELQSLMRISYAVFCLKKKN